MPRFIITFTVVTTLTRHGIYFSHDSILWVLAPCQCYIDDARYKGFMGILWAKLKQNLFFIIWPYGKCSQIYTEKKKRTETALLGSLSENWLSRRAVSPKKGWKRLSSFNHFVCAQQFNIKEDKLCTIVHTQLRWIRCVLALFFFSVYLKADLKTSGGTSG